MTIEKEKKPGPFYSCGACSKWVPVDAAVAAQEGDRPGHFCGLDCYEKWSAKLKEMRERST